MYFCGKEKQDSRNCGMRDSREKGAGMRDQDLPFQTLSNNDIIIISAYRNKV